MLVVDDNVDLAGTLGVALEDRGCTVMTAYDGQAALDLALAHPFDAAIVDIGLPKMSGLAVARQLRELRPMLLLIAHSAWGDPEDRDRSRCAGFNHHVVKPALLQQLTTHVGCRGDQHLGRSCSAMLSSSSCSTTGSAAPPAARCSAYHHAMTVLTSSAERADKVRPLELHALSIAAGENWRVPCGVRLT